MKTSSQATDLRTEGVEDNREIAAAAGLHYVTHDQPGYSRKRAGKGFAFVDEDGKTIRDRKVVVRLRKLAIPPAYKAVWISPDPKGHLQVVGKDARGRKQYRYHADWRSHRDATKYDRMLDFAKALPGLRKCVKRDMAKDGLPREKVLATVVHLLETSLIRVGNDEYAKENKSYGLTTLKEQHVEVAKNESSGKLKFQFKGKSNKEWKLELNDRRVAKVLRQLQDLPGQQVFQYLDEDGVRHGIDSADVNAYLREIGGEAVGVTAKDFRTWAGTVLATLALREVEKFDSETAAKKNIKAAIESVAQKLGNTPTICRQCYVHPEVFEKYLDRSLMQNVDKQAAALLKEEGMAGMSAEEALVLVLLKQKVGEAAKNR